MSSVARLNRPRRRLRAAAAGALWLAGLGPLAAAPGFIAGSQVTRGDVAVEVTVEFRCGIQLLGHEPDARGDQLRIRLESTGICRGATPSIADTHEQFRPVSADDARLVAIEYDGETAGDRYLRLIFSEEVRFFVAPLRGGAERLTIRVFPGGGTRVSDARPATGRGGHEVRQPAPPKTRFVINLASWQRPPATGDLLELRADEGTRVRVVPTVIDGKTWYRVRVGDYDSAAEATAALARYRARYPDAWVDRAGPEPGTPGPAAATAAVTPAQDAAPGITEAPAAAGAETADAEVEALMRDARRAMTAGELSRAVQIYTKILQLPPSPHHPEAQEFLALARERNGQLAHARAEYQRYLDVYADSEGTPRVQQRLAALLAGAAAPAPDAPAAAAAAPAATASRREPGDWKLRSFWSQFYRRDVNQLNDEDEIVSQSSVYTDASFDLRRRGERFDVTARVTAGYRSNLLDEQRSTGNDLRISYAYADMVDSLTRLRGRIGRQTRNTGGVLGRFDGINLGYAATDWLRFDAVAGRPVYSTADDLDASRQFYGMSTNFGPAGSNLDMGLFALQQRIEDLTDRQAVGAELRYFGERGSLWSVVNYDTEFEELGSVFLQGTWRLPSRLTFTGLVDRRRSPFLNLGNALVGQGVESIADLRLVFSEDELRQLALDRSAESTTVTVGMSQPLSTRLQLNLNASQASISATPESGGVAATPATIYRYYSANFVASSLFTEGDVGILGLRYTDTDSTEIYSVNLDTRLPLGRRFRLSPRLRVDHRRMRGDESTQWIYTPGLRLQYRWNKRIRLELEAGREYSNREMETVDMDRKSYFVNLGYQVFY